MKRHTLIYPALAILSLTGCEPRHVRPKESEVISTRCIHRFGYDIEPAEWKGKNYPGKVITTQRNGVVITENFEDGRLHGEKSQTYPHSQTFEFTEAYVKGSLVRRTNFSIRGIPVTQEDFIGVNHSRKTHWFKSGTPRAKEEYLAGKLIQAEYYTTENELESTIDKGSGTRVLRDERGLLLSKELLESSELIKRETFHDNGYPHVVENFLASSLHGKRTVHTEAGDPISVENYKHGLLDGICSYFQNGYKYKEVPYHNGLREGLEKHFVDGETLVEESEWHDNKRHGPSVIYYDGIARTSWFYNNEKVSKDVFDEYVQREDEIADLVERANMNTRF